MSQTYSEPLLALASLAASCSKATDFVLFGYDDKNKDEIAIRSVASYLEVIRAGRLLKPDCPLSIVDERLLQHYPDGLMDLPQYRNIFYHIPPVIMPPYSSSSVPWLDFNNKRIIPPPDHQPADYPQ